MLPELPSPPSPAAAAVCRRRVRPRLLAVLLVCVASVVAWAEPSEPVAAAEPERRTVVAFYDGGDEDFFLDIQNPLHQHIALPLHHLGLQVLEYDIRGEPPAPEVMADARAVVTYLTGTDHPAPWLRDWLDANVDPERHRWVLLGDPGALLYDDDGRPDDGRWLAERLGAHGLGYDDAIVAFPVGLTVDVLRPEAAIFERDPRAVARHLGPWVESPENEVWVRTQHVAGSGRTRVPVLVGDWGGIALDPWFLDIGTPVAEHADSRWVVDPFTFFREALGLEGVPAADPCVAFGRRLFFFHVDGDGFESFSTVSRGDRCGQVLLDQVADRYDLPMSLSIIVASLTDELHPSEPTDRMLTARELFARPNVEPATHTVLHPFAWQPELYPAGVYDRMQAFDGLSGYEPSPAAEVRESLAFIDRYLLDEGRHCRLVFWSGDCTPPVEALRAVEEAGAVSLNGGEYRVDATAPSLSRVRGLVRRVDGLLQVYCGAPNENVYPGFFDHAPGAFGAVTQTIEATGTPRILKPADVYAHFYSAASAPRLDALHGLLQRWGLREETNRVFASDYARAARSAFSTASWARTADGWSLRGFGDCPTARIDGELRRPDLARSRGIAGWRRLNGSLYVHLTDGDAELVLSDAPPSHPYVRAADHLLADVQLAPDRVSWRSQAHSSRWIELAGFPPGDELDVELGGYGYETRADERGRVEIVIPGPGDAQVEVVQR